MDHNRHLHIDLVLSLILLAQAKRKRKRIKEKLPSIIRKLYGVSSGRSIIFSPAWDFIRSSLKPEKKAAHINLRRLAAQLPNKSGFLLLQRYRAQGHNGSGIRRRQQSITQCQTSCQLNFVSKMGEICWQEVIMILIILCPKRQPTSPSPE